MDERNRLDRRVGSVGLASLMSFHAAAAVRRTPPGPPDSTEVRSHGGPCVREQLGTRGEQVVGLLDQAGRPFSRCRYDADRFQIGSQCHEEVQEVDGRSWRQLGLQGWPSSFRRNDGSDGLNGRGVIRERAAVPAGFRNVTSAGSAMNEPEDRTEVSSGRCLPWRLGRPKQVRGFTDDFDSGVRTT